MARGLPTGIVRTAHGYRTFQWIPDPRYPNGRIASKRWPAGASLDDMKRWREQQRVEARAPKPVIVAPVTPEGFAAEAAAYLEAVRAMSTFKDRARDIGIWIAVFQNTPRAEITSAMIRTWRDRWLTVGPKRVREKRKGTEPARFVDKPIPLSASAVNHRLRALENLYTVLDGRGGRNPVRDVPEAAEPELEPRAIPYELVERILAALPDRSQGLKGVSRDGDSKTKARLDVMAYTGLSPADLKRVRPEDLQLAGKVKTLYKRPRKKGRAIREPKGTTVPILPQAVRAFKRFAALNCWGGFSVSSLGKSFRRACHALNLPALRPYDLRHSFGTLAFAQSGDEASTGRLLGHRDPRTTARYTLGAVDARLAAVVTSMRRKAPQRAKRASR